MRKLIGWTLIVLGILLAIYPIGWGLQLLGTTMQGKPGPAFDLAATLWSVLLGRGADPRGLEALAVWPQRRRVMTVPALILPGMPLSRSLEAGELHITNDLYERIVELCGWPR